MTVGAAGPGWANPNKRRFKRSQKAERAAASALGGRPLPQSGAQPVARIPGSPTQRGDFQTAIFHAEHKRTELNRMSVQRAWFAKVSAGAKLAFKVPAVVLLFETRATDPEWIFLPIHYFVARFPTVANFQGVVIETLYGSCVLRADGLPVAAEGRVPTLALSWQSRSGGEPEVWVGVPLARVQGLLRE